MNTSQKKGHDWLLSQGFNLQAVLCPQQWPQSIEKAMRECEVEISPARRFVLLGAAGSRLWQLANPLSAAMADPLDDFSVNAAAHVVAHHWGGGDIEILYPGERLVPLQQLGSFVGWSSGSPLGLGIHLQFGTWFAYRVLFATDAALDQMATAVSPRSPCLDCDETPCQTACPAAAVRPGGVFDLDACVAQRLRVASPCAQRCLARLACPAGQSWHYAEEQLSYHGRRSLDSLKQWVARDQGARRTPL